MAQAGLFGGESSLPEGMEYRAGFVTPAEEAALLEEIGRLELREAKYREYTARRRIASFGAEYDFVDNKLRPGPPLPAFLLPLREKLAAWLGLPAASLEQALVTEYRAGSALGWHRDAPDFGVVAGVSLAADCAMRLRPWPAAKGRNPHARTIELAARSAYVFRDAARWAWQHAIPATPRLRYSITCRTLR